MVLNLWYFLSFYKHFHWHYFYNSCIPEIIDYINILSLILFFILRFFLIKDPRIIPKRPESSIIQTFMFICFLQLVLFLGLTIMIASTFTTLNTPAVETTVTNSDRVLVPKELIHEPPPLDPESFKQGQIYNRPKNNEVLRKDVKWKRQLVIIFSLILISQ